MLFIIYDFNGKNTAAACDKMSESDAEILHLSLGMNLGEFRKCDT